MSSFIKAAEVWVPSHDQSMLEFGGGWFGSATRFGAISRDMCFGRAEGLPGRAWDEGRPIVLKQFEGSYFRRTSAAQAAGLTCAIAVPVFVSDALTAVLVFFCGDDEAHAGAIELWRNDPRVTTDMTLVDGYFGGGGDTAFEDLTRDTYLPRGSGLPGLAWQRGAAVMIDDLAQSSRFLRGKEAAELGMTRALAIPVSTPGAQNYVLSFLSAAGTPIAQRIENWAPDETGASLQRQFGFCEVVGSLPSLDEGLPLGDAAGAIGRAFASGVAAVNESAASEPGVGASAAEAGLVSLVAVPVVVDGVVSEVVVLYF